MTGSLFPSNLVNSDWRTAPIALRYSAVSVVCAVVNNILLIAFASAGLSSMAAAAAVVPPMIAIGFLLQVAVVFQAPPTWSGLWRYTGAMLSNQPLWFASLYLFSNVLRLPIYVAGPLATIFLFFWNFFATRWAIRGQATPREGAPANDVRRIAYVCDAVMPWNKGGREMILHQVCRRMARPDQEVHIYTMNWWGGPTVIERDGVHFHALCAHRPLYVGDKRSTKQALLFALSVFKLVFERFDALHVDHMPFFPLYSARIVAWLKGVRLTAIWHEVWGRDYWLHYMGGPAGLIGYLLERGSFLLPDAIASDSALTTTRLRANGVACELQTLPLGVDVKNMRSIAPADVESDVIYVGRLLTHKGVDLLLKALVILKAANPGLRALIVGAGPESASLQQMAETLSLGDTVRFLGEVPNNEQVIGLMKGSKLLVLPSRREGFGLVVLEANAAGLPVVTLRHPDNAAQELVREGVNGFLSEPDEQDLARNIRRALEERDALRPMADIEQFDWDNVARQLEGFLWRTQASVAVTRRPREEVTLSQ